MKWLAVLLLAVSTAATAADDPPICPDRPSKANGTCTVPAGHFQVETSLVDWTHSSAGGVESDLTLWASTVVKYGLGDRSDVELGITPLVTFRLSEGGRTSGFGDMTVRVKRRLSRDGSPVQATVIPFVKLPTASHDLGNGKVEGGVTVPVNIGVANNVTLAIGPELDWRADSDRSGHHLGMAQLVNLGLAATARLAFAAELWGSWDWDPAGTTWQYSADGSVAYLLSDSMQIDGGANFGLNRSTPDVEFYAGVSKRF